MRLVVGKAARLAGRGRDPNLMASRRTAPPGMVPLADETMVEVDGGRLRVNEVFRPALQAAGLTSLDALMAYRGGETYREAPGRRTVRLELPDPAGGRKTVYLKRYTRVPWRKGLARLFSLGDPVSLALAEGRSIVRLADAGIATMRIVALGEEVTRRALAERSCLVTEEIAGAVQADVYCETAFGGDRSRAGTAAKRRLVRAIARLAREFHGAGFTHRDLYLCHLLVRPVDGADPALHLIDLARVQYYRRGAGRRRIVKDLAALLFSSEPSPATHIRSRVFTRTDRMRFACGYFGARPLTGGQKDLVRSVIRKADAIAGHERRRRARSGAAG
jgi:heptose I phosphotransferase